MSLADILQPNTRPPGRPTRSVRLLTVAEPEENPVPRTKSKPEAKPEKAAAPAAKEKPQKRKYTRRNVKRKPGPKPGRKPAPKASSREPRFGVFDDGSVRINLPRCKGDIAPGDARDLLAFMSTRLSK